MWREVFKIDLKIKIKNKIIFHAHVREKFIVRTPLKNQTYQFYFHTCVHVGEVFTSGAKVPNWREVFTKCAVNFLG